MTNIYKLIYDTLTALGYPVREQGTYAPDETLPDTFVTYLLVDSPNASHADNVPTSTVYRVQVDVYSRDPSLTQGADRTVKGVLLPAGFLRASGRGMPFSPDTGHYRFMTEYRYYDLEVD